MEARASIPLVRTAAATGVALALAAQHVRDAGIVEREKRGSCAHFSIADGALQHVCALLGYAVEPVAAPQPVGVAA